MTLLSPESVPGGSAVLNPFVVVDDAAGLITFVTEVFGAVEVPEARSPMPDGKLIHSQLRLGTADLMIVDRMEGWPAWPGLLQIWVDDVAATLKRAADHGGVTVTEATPFWGETTLGRMRDPWGNIWWFWAPAPGQPDPADEEQYAIFGTIDEAFRASRG